MTSPLGQNRGGTPIGVRLLLEARPCQQHGRLERASVGVPLPFSFRRREDQKRKPKRRHHPFIGILRPLLRASSVAAIAKLARRRAARTRSAFPLSPAFDGEGQKTGSTP